MKNKNDKLLIENYTGEFNFKRSSSNILVSFNRVAFIFFLFLIIFIIFSLKILYLLNSEKVISKNLISSSDFRSTITDRNQNIIAKSVITKNIGINPQEITNKNKLLISLKLIFPYKDFNEINKKIEKKKFFYLEKKISNDKYNEIIMLGDKSIKQEQKISRVYPQQNLFSHVLGQIDEDNNGVSGVENILIMS